MSLSIFWSLIEGPLATICLGLVLLIVALALLKEYRRLFFADPVSVMSVEVLLQIVAQSGGPGYFAGFLLAAAVLSFAGSFISLAFNLISYFGG